MHTIYTQQKHYKTEKIMKVLFIDWMDKNCEVFTSCYRVEDNAVNETIETLLDTDERIVEIVESKVYDLLEPPTKPKVELDWSVVEDFFEDDDMPDDTVIELDTTVVVETEDYNTYRRCALDVDFVSLDCGELVLYGTVDGSSESFPLSAVQEEYEEQLYKDIIAEIKSINHEQ